MITRILVANRGEIARRVFRTCRELNLETVAVFSPADRYEPHVWEADEAVELPGSTPAESYLNIDAILGAAKLTGTDAIHPGYGFLSENGGFARAVIEAGLIWIGPDPDTIEAMGSKIEAKRLVEEAGVPVLPSVEIIGSSVVQTAALALGFPVLIKASAGGGGKGMRVVTEPRDLDAAVASAEREARAAFGDETVFMEKYLPSPRHIEVQIFGDRHGNVVSLFERECSIQRRHQKIIEESPSPAIDEETRVRLGAAAVEAARAVNYVGAGTVEFLHQNDQFYFLEMNTRLQVEHPVTEMVTGLDLVKLQIEVAEGGTVSEPAPPVGHAIEARLYAEDPVNDFLPATGQVLGFEFEEMAGVRIDSGIESGSTVSIHYDPMIAKVIAHSTTREAAAALLARALRAARIHGPVTNRALLVGILEHPEFLAGQTDTNFLDRNHPADLGRSAVDPRTERLSAAAVALADQALARLNAPVLGTIPSGWRNSPVHLHHRAYEGDHGRHDIRYQIDPEGATVYDLDGTQVVEVTPDLVVMEVDGEVHRIAMSRYGTERYADSSLGPVKLEALSRLNASTPEDAPGSLHAPMPGVVLRVDVTPGDRVSEGQVLLVIEAMKMEHSLKAPYNGTVSEVAHRAGDQIEAGAVLVTVEPDPTA